MAATSPRPFTASTAATSAWAAGATSTKTATWATARIDIGDRVLFGPRVRLHTQHQATDRPEPICIEDDCWLCAGVIVGPGVRIGRGSVIAAGCVITRDVAPHSLMRGNPAQLVRTLRPSGD